MGLFIRLVITIFGAILFEPFMTQNQVIWCLTASVQLKEILLFLLPWMIGSYIATALLSIKEQAPWLIFGIIGLATFSNAFASFLAYGLGIVVLPYFSQGTSVLQSFQGQSLSSFEIFLLPRVIDPSYAMLLGMGLGFLFRVIHVPVLEKALFLMKEAINWFLQTVFIPLLPVFILGFTLKIKREGILFDLAAQYSQIFVFLWISVTLYVLFLYAIGTGFRFKPWIESIRNMLPAWITGMATMSSAATMPVTLASTEKNIKDPDFVRLVIATTVNIHMVGVSLGTALLALSLLTLTGHPLPDFWVYSNFVLYFCLARFSTAAIPGGSLLVLLPIVQIHLGFDQNLSSLITLIYILQDPLSTSANVMSNGAFAMIFHRLIRKKNNSMSQVTENLSA